MDFSDGVLYKLHKKDGEMKINLNITQVYFLGLICLSIGLSFTSKEFFTGVTSFGIGTIIFAVVRAMIDDLKRQ